jgi:hypothetical protein
VATGNNGNLVSHEQLSLASSSLHLAAAGRAAGRYMRQTEWRCHLGGRLQIELKVVTSERTTHEQMHVSASSASIGRRDLPAARAVGLQSLAGGPSRTRSCAPPPREICGISRVEEPVHPSLLYSRFSAGIKPDCPLQVVPRTFHHQIRSISRSAVKGMT